MLYSLEMVRLIVTLGLVLSSLVSGFCSFSTLFRGARNSNICIRTASDDSSCDGVRLNKVFKATHSRRQADELIASGRVTINGKPVDSAGSRVAPYRDVIRLDGQIVTGWEALNACSPQQKTTSDDDTTAVFEYIKYWKPCGVICTTDRSIPSNILDRLEQDGFKPNNRIFPVGRLDKETSGLILLTSDGRLPNSALRGQFKQPKRYNVLVNQPLTEREVQELRDGVVITTQAQRDGKRAEPLTARTKPCLVQVSKKDRRRLRMTLREGRNRQIRKMIEALGLHVVALGRYEFMDIGLYPLQGAGEWARLSPSEMEIVSQVISSAQEAEETKVEESW